jgi:hypothetical protein
MFLIGWATTTRKGLWSLLMRFRHREKFGDLDPSAFAKHNRFRRP